MTYIDLLKRALAGETETVRLYLAVMAVAPNSAIPRLLEIRPVGLHREGLHVDRHVLVVPGKNGGRTVFHRENEVVVDNEAGVFRFPAQPSSTAQRKASPRSGMVGISLP